VAGAPATTTHACSGGDRRDRGRANTPCAANVLVSLIQRAAGIAPAMVSASFMYSSSLLIADC
jgi:hypothetical protein